jgi:hypothetical protein
MKIMDIVFLIYKLNIYSKGLNNDNDNNIKTYLQIQM